MLFLTDFADQAVVLPIVAAVAVVLAAQGWWRGAFAWLTVVGITLGVILTLKLGFHACGPVFVPWELRSPSGHTAAASVVAGGLVALLAGRRAAVVCVALLAAVVIGLSRLELGAHSPPEVVIGALTGVAGAALLSRLAGTPPTRRPVSLLAVAFVVAMLLHGMRLPAEAAILRFSHGALDFVPACRGGANPPLYQARP
jgi:membrane-associated phospholipid phosphatase